MHAYVLLTLAVLWFLAVAAFLLAIGRTYFLREELAAAPADAPPVLPRVTIVIPARDEEHNIPRCLDHVVALEYPHERLQVVVVDDHSADRTGAILADYAARHPFIEPLASAELPDGWKGKTFACHQGAAAARGDWLLFLDADTYVRPGLLRALLAHAGGAALDLVSLIPFQQVVSPGERLWLPGMFLGIAAAIDFRRVNDPADPYALANGQCLLFRREAYTAIGGHAAIRAAIADDVAFAVAAKQARLAYHCLFGDRWLETRMYRSLGEIWRGFTRNLPEIMHTPGPARVALASLRSLGVGLGALLLPFAGWHAVGGGGPADVAAGVILLGLAGLLTAFFAVARELRMPPLYALAVPLGLILHGLALVQAFRRKRQGRREWKGREYSA